MTTLTQFHHDLTRCSQALEAHKEALQSQNHRLNIQIVLLVLFLIGFGLKEWKRAPTPPPPPIPTEEKWRFVL